MNLKGKWFVIGLVVFIILFLVLEFWVIKKVKAHPEKHLQNFEQSHLKIG
jgi:phosphotransferase system  glucose/maltose/N-acetylglucosamine-specific IIC component